jgi:hypothetical protein
VGGGPGDTESAADVVPGVASVMGVDGELSEQDPELFGELVAGDEASEWIVFSSEEPDELLPAKGHGGLLQRDAFRKALAGRRGGVDDASAEVKVGHHYRRNGQVGAVAMVE